MSLSNLLGPWRWEQRGESWWRVNDRFRISTGPYPEPLYQPGDERPDPQHNDGDTSPLSNLQSRSEVAHTDGCEHTEHAIRAGFGRIGRYFEGLNDQVGKWERCPARNDGSDT